MVKERCDGCRSWEYDDENGYGVEIGKCHRYPPSLHRQRVENYPVEEIDRLGPVVFYDFPLTSNVQWCGEFQPASKSTT